VPVVDPLKHVPEVAVVVPEVIFGLRIVVEDPIGASRIYEADIPRPANLLRGRLVRIRSQGIPTLDLRIILGGFSIGCKERDDPEDICSIPDEVPGRPPKFQRQLGAVPGSVVSSAATPGSVDAGVAG
jgi:hypothetical protein